MAVNVKYKRHEKIYTKACHHQLLQTRDKGEGSYTQPEGEMTTEKNENTGTKQSESRFLTGCNASKNTARLPL